MAPTLNEKTEMQYVHGGEDNAAYMRNGTTENLEKFEECDIESDTKDSVEEDDPWAMSTHIVKVVPWKELSTKGKVHRVLWNYIFRQVLLIFLLYLFICSLDFLSSAFRLLGGKAAGKVFSESEILSNPVAGLMIGVLCTVLVQSSSTSTSIVVSMVASEILDVKTAIPIIMGANIGTSVTNTIVSLGQAGNKNEFRRAFGGATVHDMFNWLSVMILLPLEVASGYLFLMTKEIVDTFELSQYKEGKIKLLKAITEPFTHYIMKVDTGLITKIVTNKTNEQDVKTLIKTVCGNETIGNETIEIKCDFMFMNVAGVWEDWVIGLILLIIALFILCSCLVGVVKILNSIFQGHIASLIKKVVNADIPTKCGSIFTGYLIMIVGALLTILVQSSSIFTSALTPLVGLGVLTIEKMYPLTLGSNIGTTFTAVLSSLAQEGSTLDHAIQISLCHLFFNISGILLWYPIPFMRKAPIFLAKHLGNTTAEYRWFAVAYLIFAFFLLPTAIFGLSIAGWKVLVGVGVPILALILYIAIINFINHNWPMVLPIKLRSWNWLPEFMRSLAPYDRVIQKMTAICSCCRKKSSNNVN